MAQLMPLPLTVSCFSKIQIGFAFLVPADVGSPGKRAIKQLCVCVLEIVVFLVIFRLLQWFAVLSFHCSYTRTSSEFYGDTIRRYVEFDAEDADYDMMQHFDIAFDVIEDARKSGGRALIHCIMGVNRSGALAVAYTMVHQQCGPITAAVYVREKRGLLLSNEDFQDQLIEFARQRDLLQHDAKEIHGTSVKM